MSERSEVSVIQLANERMSIIDACNELGMDVFDFSIASLKTYCPFGHIAHDDEGRTKAFRIYPATNSAWCFACQAYYTPVKLIAMDKDISEEAAAQWILETTGYVAPDYQARWEAVTTPEETVDTDALAETLKLRCRRLSRDWEERQFDEEVSKKLQLCLGLLRKVKTKEDSSKWLDIATTAMRTTLGEPRS